VGSSAGSTAQANRLLLDQGGREVAAAVHMPEGFAIKKTEDYAYRRLSAASAARKQAGYKSKECRQARAWLRGVAGAQARLMAMLQGHAARLQEAEQRRGVA